MLGLSYSNPYKLGQQSGAAAGSMYTASQRRALLLAQLMQQGKLKVQDLSQEDLALATPKLGQTQKHGEGILGKILGGIGNLGSDIGDATKGLPTGIAEQVGAVAHDVTGLAGYDSGPVLGPHKTGALRVGPRESEIKNKIIDPQLQYYEYTYGGKGAPEGSSLLGRIYQHPLAPILDAASVISLGTGTAARGAAAASRAGIKGFGEGSLPHRALVSTERAPIISGQIPDKHVDEGVIVPEIPREYSTRPLRRALQFGTDQIAKIPYAGRPVEALQHRLTATQRQRSAFSTKELKGNIVAAREAVQPIMPLLAKLDADEVAAIPLIGMRINEPALMDLRQIAVKEGLAGNAPDGQNVPSAIDPRLAESRAEPSDRTRQLAADPTQSPALVAFLDKYTERLQSRMYPNIGEEKVKEYVDAPRSALLQRYGIEEPNPPEAPVPDTPEIATDTEISRFDWNKMRKAQRDEGIYTEDLQMGKKPDTGPRDEWNQLQGNLENLLARLETGDIFDAPKSWEGGFLTPTQVSSNVKYSDPGRLGRLFGKEQGFELGRRNTFNAQNVGYQDLFRSASMAGKPDVDAVLAGVVRPDRRQFLDFLTKHERDQIESAFNEKQVFENALKDKNGQPIQVPGHWTAAKVQQEYGKDWVPVNPDMPWNFFEKETTLGQAVQKMEAHGLDMSEINARMGAEAEDFAIDSTLAAQRTPNVIVPKKYAEYQLALATAHLPYKYGISRASARAMNVWRTHTLTYMPRWALNTAVGSFVLATVKGISPRQYMAAQKLRGVGKAEGNMFFDRPETAGVNLASVAAWDQLEMGAMGHTEPLNIKTGAISRPIMRRVQQIEDHFRRASFVQSLDKRARQAMNEQGTIISNLERSRGPRSTEEYAKFVLQNPDMVRAAIEDLNKFSYNFATLGPAERRYVRQIVPFWGWYKFISSLAYRLPVDYPGRSAILAHTGMLGTATTEDQYGRMPGWLKGAVGLTSGVKGFKYLSTMGTNPFSQIFNPMGSEGLVAGSLQLGQGSPLVQSLLTAYGLDTMRGDSVPISPQTMADAGVGRSFFGTLVGKSGTRRAGDTVSSYQVAPGSRLLAAIIRSFPAARIAERQRAGGRSSFPESLPWAPRPMPTKPESRFGGAGSEVLEQMLGIAPRPYDLKGWQQLAEKQGKYATTQNKNELRKLRKNLRNP